MEGVRWAAERALEGLRCYGAPPPNMAGMERWAWQALGVDVRWVDWLPGRADGFCYSARGRGFRGRVLLTRDCIWPRFTLAHEIGHLLLGNGASFSHASAAWLMLPAEREANAYAAMLTIPLADLTERFLDGWAVEQVAVRLCVPEDAIAVRMQLGRLLAEADMATLEARLDRLGGAVVAT